MLSFHHPQWLWGLLLVLLAGVIWIGHRRWQQTRLKTLADASLQGSLWASGSMPSGTNPIAGLLPLLALACLVVAAAGLYLPKGQRNQPAKGTDVMVVLDASRSMNARDVQPDRMRRARSFVTRLAEQLQGDRMGLVVFAGRPYLQVPLTTDRGAFRLALQAVSPEAIPTQGTILSTALTMAAGSFSEHLRRSRVLVLITDGEDHDEASGTAVADLKKTGVQLIALGVGTPEGIGLQEADGSPKTDLTGAPVITRLGEASLRRLTEDAGGRYLRLRDATANAAEVAQFIRTLPAAYLPKDAEQPSEKEYFPYLAAAALVLLVLQRLLQSARSRKAVSGIGIAGVLLLCSVQYAQAQNRGWQEGTRLYREGKFPEAAAAFQQALSDSVTRAAAQYNLGNALYKKKDFAGAAKAFEQAAQSPGAPDAAYNLGNSYAEQKQWKQAMEAYKEALRSQPGTADAQRNYAKARKHYLQEQQQQQQQQRQQPQPKDDSREDPRAQKEATPSDLNKEQAEKLLQALRQEEQKINDRKREGQDTPTPPEKDW
ncbi:MAG: VWA domain-containing protein [Sphingobacteriales bacterium]|nr:MAG: VWA domain-containing protein [Sphingobacteriales bacterium]